MTLKYFKISMKSLILLIASPIFYALLLGVRLCAAVDDPVGDNDAGLPVEANLDASQTLSIVLDSQIRMQRGEDAAVIILTTLHSDLCS